jgi:predicted kinase
LDCRRPWLPWTLDDVAADRDLSLLHHRSPSVAERRVRHEREGTIEVPTLTLFCGLPGAGKTTLAKRLEADGNGIRICTDDWQAELGVPHADVGFHERLQPLLYRHALLLLRHGTNVILEDGLWRREERIEKFGDARAVGAEIELHVFEVGLETLWSRLQARNDEAIAGAYPMTYEELRTAWSLFQPPSPDELTAVDRYTIHNLP